MNLVHRVELPLGLAEALAEECVESGMPVDKLIEAMLTERQAYRRKPDDTDTDAKITAEMATERSLIRPSMRRVIELPTAPAHSDDTDTPT
jgi:hypothetical protein